MTNVTWAVESWLKTLLATDGTLVARHGGRVYKDVAPPGTATPLVAYRRVRGEVDANVGGAGSWELDYLVDNVTVGASYDPLNELVERETVLLTSVPGVSGTVRILGCQVLREVQEAELTGGEPEARHWGLVVRLWAQPA